MNAVKNCRIPFALALIYDQKSRNLGKRYRAFHCPYCRAICGDYYIERKWERLISQQQTN